MNLVDNGWFLSSRRKIEEDVPQHLHDLWDILFDKYRLDKKSGNDATGVTTSLCHSSKTFLQIELVKFFQRSHIRSRGIRRSGLEKAISYLKVILIPQILFSLTHLLPQVS